MNRILLCLVIIAGLPSVAAGSIHGKELEKLDDLLSQKAIYEQYLLDRVQILKSVLSSLEEPEQIYDVNRRIAQEFFSYSKDSTMHYLEVCIDVATQLKDDAKVAETRILMAEEHNLAGNHFVASGILESIDSEKLPPQILRAYYVARHNLAGELLAYAIDSHMFQVQDSLREHYRNLLMKMTQPETFDWYALKREECWQYGKKEEALEYSRKMVEMSEEGTHDYAMACYFYQEMLDKETHHDEKIEWLIRSARADVMSATKDYASLNFLSQFLFDEGDIDRAFTYSAEHCMPDAIFFGGTLRPWQIAKFFPEIGKAYQQKNHRWQRTMWLMVAVMSCLVLLMGGLVTVIYLRQRVLDMTRKALAKSYMEIEKQNADLVAANGKLSELNSKIVESDKIKQEYITLFLSMLSENISTTRQYKNHVLRYIRMGNTAEIVSEIEALPPIDNDINEFYRMFDHTFLNLYPDFVDKFNTLLVPEAEIVQKNPDTLTPELRVFALIKLGIADSSQIANLLHYSANTIYNYRAKTKNKARGDRAHFEDAVREI